jgi:hypothetical protein
MLPRKTSKIDLPSVTLTESAIIPLSSALNNPGTSPIFNRLFMSSINESYLI